MLQFQIEPPKITPWLNEDEKEGLISLLDIQIDSCNEDDEYRFDFDIVFKSVPIRKGIVGRSNFYVGSTGGEIYLHVENCKIKEYTGPTTLDVSYNINEILTRKTDLNLIPFSQKNSQKVNAQLKYEKSKEVSWNASFRSEERTLVPAVMNNSLIWEIAQPNIKKVIRDYLFGNLYLFATCSLNSKNIEGKIKVTTDVRFFNTKKEAVSTVKSALMLYVMTWKEKTVYNIDGLEIKFSNKF